MRLIEEIASKDNLNQAFLQVIGNKGASGIDNMTCDEITTHIKITNDRKSQSVNQVPKAGKICVLPREVLEI